MNGSDWHIYKTFTAHSDSITSMIHLKSTNLLVSSSSNGELKVWNYTENNLIDDELLVVDLLGHVGAVYSIKELDSGLLVSAGADKIIKAWNLSAEVLLDSEIQTNHVDSIIDMIVVNGSILVTGSLDTKIKAWNAKSFLVGEELTTINTTGAVYSLVSIKGTVIAFSGADFRIYLWDIETSVLIGTLYGHTNQVFSMLKLVGTPSNKGFYVGSASFDGVIGVWRINLSKGLFELASSLYIESEQMNYSALIQLENENIAAGSFKDNRIRVWNFTHAEFNLETTTATTTATTTTSTITTTTATILETFLDSCNLELFIL